VNGVTKPLRAGWVKCKLGDQLMLQRGFDLTQKQCFPGDYPVISSGGTSAFHNEFKAEGPGVLLGRKGSVGAVHYVEMNYWPHDTTLWVKDFKGNHPRFIYYFFRWFPISQFEASTANPTLNRNRLHPVEVLWPPLEEQRRIAAILDKADAVRQKRKEAIALTEELLRSAFLEMFGNPVTNPKGWKIQSFEEVCERIFKGAFDLKASLYQSSGVPFIRISDIQDGTIDLSKSVFISEKALASYTQYSVVPGDLVFSKVGTIDRIGIVPPSISTAVISQNNVGAKLKREIMKPAFALAYLTTDYSLARIRATSKKAVQDKLVLSELRGLSIPVPPLEYQDQFFKVQESVSTTQQRIQQSSVHSDNLFNSLLQRAFRGEL